MKPPGIYLTAGHGSVSFNVRHPSKVEDAIWAAVEEAILAGWDARAFKIEAASAWEESLRRQAKDAAAELQR
jgi:hypothetical protein